MRENGNTTAECFTRRKQELGDEVKVVQGEVCSAGVADPAQGIAAAVYQPEVHVQRDVCGDGRVAVGELGQCGGTCLLVENEAGDVLQSVPCFAVARFMMACSFMATSGPGSATRVLTSTGGPFDDATVMVTSLAVSVAQAWAEACKRSPGSSLGSSIYLPYH